MHDWRMVNLEEETVKGRKDGKAVARASMVTSMPLVLADAATRLVSCLTGDLEMPPAFGIKTAVGSAILASGLPSHSALTGRSC